MGLWGGSQVRSSRCLSSFFRSVVLEVPGDVLGMQILRPTSELLTVPGRAQHR